MDLTPPHQNSELPIKTNVNSNIDRNIFYILHIKAELWLTWSAAWFWFRIFSPSTITSEIIIGIWNSPNRIHKEFTRNHHFKFSSCNTIYMCPVFLVTIQIYPYTSRVTTMLGGAGWLILLHTSFSLLLFIVFWFARQQMGDLANLVKPYTTFIIIS